MYWPGNIQFLFSPYPLARRIVKWRSGYDGLVDNQLKIHNSLETDQASMPFFWRVDLLLKVRSHLPSLTHHSNSLAAMVFFSLLLVLASFSGLKVNKQKWKDTAALHQHWSQMHTTEWLACLHGTVGSEPKGQHSRTQKEFWLTSVMGEVSTAPDVLDLSDQRASDFHNWFINPLNKRDFWAPESLPLSFSHICVGSKEV